jgi:hypothetical protein
VLGLTIQPIHVRLNFYGRSMVVRVLLILLTWLRLPLLMAATPEIAVASPRPGEALQGVVTITGSTVDDQFTSMELSFAYNRDVNRTWFLISESTQPVAEGTLATWDTTTITDGDYDLRLLVTLKDGTPKVVVVSGLRVRNYTPVETSTPTVTQPAPPVTPQPSMTPTVTPVPPSPTPLPTNPARLTGIDYAVNATLGALTVFALFGMLGAYLGIRKRMRR